MSWRYGIVKDEFGYGLCEVYMDDNGKIYGHTCPIAGGDCDTIRGVIDELRAMMDDALKYDVVDTKDLPEEGAVIPGENELERETNERETV